MKLYKTSRGIIVQHNGAWSLMADDWDKVVNQTGLYARLSAVVPALPSMEAGEAEVLINAALRPPVGSQEVWAAGVTYMRSREARMEESAESGAADLYDRVYAAERPELFFKSMPDRVAPSGADVYIRRDSEWNVPEPELTLFMSSAGSVEGYTIGNDMSSRSIEGENALYLPQAKIYERSAALGPCLYVPALPIPAETEIEMSIRRSNVEIYADRAAIQRMKRSFADLSAYLFRECDFPAGCFLMTGTCLVPPPDFTLQVGDLVTIRIEPIGELVNTIAYKPLSL